MSVSIERLTKLFATKNLEPQRFFDLYDRCAFVEVLDHKTGDTYMFYIPSKYEMIVNNEKTFSIKPLDISTNELDNYAGKYSYKNINEMYENIDIDVNNDQIYDKIVDNYRTTIDFNTKEDLEKEDIISLYRQMLRFKYCVQNIRYKFVILYKNYMCVLHIGDDIECFKIKHTKFEKTRKLIILMDLELFYENIETLDEDLSQVRDGIQYILDKNHISHSKYIKNIISNKKDIGEITDNIIQKKDNIRNYVLSFKNLLNRILDSESEILEKYKSDISKYDTNTINGDMAISSIRSNTEKELRHIDNLKKQIINNIKRLQNKEVNLSLIVDIILFDNTVMLNKVFNNIEQLLQCCD